MEFLDFDDICSMAELSEKFNKKIFDRDGKKVLERLFETELDEKEMKWEFFCSKNHFCSCFYQPCNHATMQPCRCKNYIKNKNAPLKFENRTFLELQQEFRKILDRGVVEHFQEPITHDVEDDQKQRILESRLRGFVQWSALWGNRSLIFLEDLLQQERKQPGKFGIEQAMKLE